MSSFPRPLGRRRSQAAFIAIVSLLLMNLFGLTVTPALAASSLTPAAFASPPIAVGGNHACALPGDGTVLCWGDNTFGQLGYGEVTDPHAPAGDVFVLRMVIADAASTVGYDCPMVTDSAARCSSPHPLAGVVAIAAGYAHTCVLLADTTVKCWGANAATPDGGMFGPPGTIGGALGDGTAVDRPAPVTVIAGPNQTSPLSGVRALSAAVGYTCALLFDTTVKCWGDGDPGNTPQTASLAPVTVMADDGASPLSNVAAISAGDFHACALMTDGSVKCWGANVGGGVSSRPVSVTTPGAPVTDLEGVTAISADHGWPLYGPNGISTGHTCALKKDTTVVCWGLNDVSQLGNGGHDDQRWAGNVVAAVGTTEDLTDVTAIASGAVFTCALMTEATVKCWGMNFGAPPGDLNGFEGAGAPVAIDETGVVAIAAGGWACGVLSDGSIRCWGSGDWVVPDLIASMGPIIVAPASIPTPTATPSIATDVGGLAGDWAVTYGSPSVVTIAFADGTYTVTAKSPVQVTGGSCFLPAGTLIATFSGSGGTYSGQHGLWWTTNCAFANWAPMTATLSNGGQTITATMTMTGLAGTTVFTRQSPPAPSSTPVVAPAEAVIGGWQNGHFAISYQDGLYSITQKITTAVSPGSSCQVPAGTVTYTFSGSGGSYSGQEVGWILPACTTTKVPVSLTFDGNTLTIVHLASGTTEVWQRSTAAAAPTAFRNSIPLPWQLNLSPEVVVPALVVGVGMILLVPFPGALFNSTLRTNYAEIMRRGRRARRRARNTLLAPWFALRTRFGVAFGPTLLPLGEEAPILTPPPAQEQRHDFWWTLPGVGLFIFLTALLSGFLDPSFWFNSASIATFVGMLIGLVLILLAFDLPSLLFYRRHALRFWPRALPATLLVSIASVLISRLTDFHPGYLYGLIITVAVAGKLEQPDEGRLLALGAISTIAIAVAAWFALGLVAPAAAASSDPLLIAVQTVLSMVVAAGVQVAAFGMLPLSFLAGEGVRKWNKPIWAGIWFFGIFAFFIVILNPQNGYLSDTTRTPFLTIIALLVFFAGSSLMFWDYFRRFHKRLDRAADVQA